MSPLRRRRYLSYLFRYIAPTQSWGMVHSLATRPSHRMVLRARSSNPESQSVAMSSDQVQSYKKYLHSLLLELQFIEEQLKNDIVTHPEACHIWTHIWTIRAKYFFLVSSLAGLGAPLTKEEQIVVLRRLAEVCHHVPKSVILSSGHPGLWPLVLFGDSHGIQRHQHAKVFKQQGLLDRNATRTAWCHWMALQLIHNAAI